MRRCIGTDSRTAEVERRPDRPIPGRAASGLRRPPMSLRSSPCPFLARPARGYVPRFQDLRAVAPGRPLGARSGATFRLLRVIV